MEFIKRNILLILALILLPSLAYGVTQTVDSDIIDGWGFWNANADITDGTITEAKLDIADAPATLEILQYNGTKPAWVATSTLHIDTNASTTCSGSTTYLDGEGNCDDISGTYVQASDWTTIDNYPSNCSDGVVYGLGDTLSCKATSTWDSNSETLCTAGNFLEGDGSCTDVLEESECDAFSELQSQIADKTLVNTADGATWLGAHDFGGADSVELPNGASPTTNATGEIALDTSSNQIQFYDGSAEQTLVYWREKCFTVASTTFDHYDNIPIWHPHDNITVTNIYCKVTGGTSLVVTVGDGTNNMDSVTCDSDGQTDDGSISNSTFNNNELMEVDFGTNTGTCDWVNYCLTYTIDAD